MTKCVYCNEEKNIEELSQEHIIPRALGGNLTPVNPFTLGNVCRTCNSRCGTYVDGPLIRNWFFQNHRANDALKFINFENNPILPLGYMGFSQDIIFEDKVCELWHGPTGDLIYHFHSPYPEEPDMPPTIGRPLNHRRLEIDNGFVFLFIRSNNPIWHPAIIRSGALHFKDSLIYLGNGPTPPGNIFSTIPDNLNVLHQKLLELSRRQQNMRFSIDSNMGDRFLAKVALGIGAKFLNPSFIESESADLLRQFMWTKNHEIRSNIPLHGSGLFSGNFGRLGEFLKWPGGHSLSIIKDWDNCSLAISLYEEHMGLIKITSEPEHWEGLLGERGDIYVISPGIQKYVGPKNISRFIAHRNTEGYNDPELLALENEMNQFDQLPPFDI